MEPCPAIIPQHSLIGGAELLNRAFSDTEAHLSRVRGVSASHDNAWETLRFSIAQDNATAKHFINMGAALAGQAGTTEGQQTVSPTRTGAADNLAAGAAPSNRITDAGSAVAGTAVDSATAQATLANVSVQVGELTTAVAALTSLVAQIVQNAKQQVTA